MTAELIKFGRRLLGWNMISVSLAEVEGLPLPPVQLSMRTWQRQISDIRELDLRDDDIFLCAYPKAGTHWVWEVISMLLAGRAEYEPRAKELLMVDMTPTSKLHKLRGPRVLNTHLPFRMLPLAGVRARRLKLVHVYRNPRDVMVSMFHHLRQFPIEQTQSMPAFRQAFLAGNVVYGHYAEYLNQMDSFITDNPDLSVFHVSYEEMKRNPHSNVQRLAEYLDVSVTDTLVNEVVEACAFNRMQKVDETKEQITFFGMEVKQELYRKGEVGDWHNHFTEEEAGVFDKEFHKVLNTNRFPFLYEL